jgi:hypothetical protein
VRISKIAFVKENKLYRQINGMKLRTGAEKTATVAVAGRLRRYYYGGKVLTSALLIQDGLGKTLNNLGC